MKRILFLMSFLLVALLANSDNILAQSCFTGASWEGPAGNPPTANRAKPIYATCSATQDITGNISLDASSGAINEAGLLVNHNSTGGYPAIQGTVSAGAFVAQFGDFTVYANSAAGNNIRIQDVSGNPEIQLQYGVTGNSDHWSLYNNQANNSLRIWGGGADRFTILQTGNVGIGTVYPSANLEVGGSFEADLGYKLIRLRRGDGALASRRWYLIAEMLATQYWELNFKLIGANNSSVNPYGQDIIHFYYNQWRNQAPVVSHLYEKSSDIIASPGQVIVTDEADGYNRVYALISRYSDAMLIVESYGTLAGREGSIVPVEFAQGSAIPVAIAGDVIYNTLVDDSQHTFEFGNITADGTICSNGGSDCIGGGGWTDDGTVVRLTTITDRVGVGNTSPQETLDVTGTFRLQDGNQTAGYVLVSDADGTGTWASVTTAQLPDTLWRLSGNNLFVSSTTWNVGIGTTIPNSKLHVRDTVDNAEINIQTNSGNHWGIYQNGTSGDLRFWNTNTGNLLTLGTDGNVGIGIDNPDAKLEVAGDISFSSSVNILKGAAYTAGGVNLLYDAQMTNGLDATRDWHSNISASVDTAEVDFIDGKKVRAIRSISASNHIIYSPYVNIDPNKTYKFSVWIKNNHAASQSREYFGIRAYASDNSQGVLNSVGTLNTNPFFYSSLTATQDRWVYVEAFMYPTNSADAPVGWRMDEDGGFSGAVTSYKWRANTVRVRIRLQNWAGSYGGVGAETVYFYMPRIVEVTNDQTIPDSRYHIGDQEVTGDVTASGQICDSVGCIGSGGSGGSGDTDWVAVGGGNPTLAGDIYHTGNVGIGNINPSIELAIGDTDTGINWISDGILAVNTNNVERMRITEGSVEFQDNELRNVKALQLQDWDDDTGGTDTTYRLLARDDTWMFFNSGVVVGNYGNGAWTETIPDGTLVVENRVGIAGRANLALTPLDPLHIVADIGFDNIHLEEYVGGEDWQLGVDSAGDLNFKDSGSATNMISFQDGGAQIIVNGNSPSIYIRDDGSTARQFRLHHNGSNTYIDYHTGVINIRDNGGTTVVQIGEVASAFQLYVNGDVQATSFEATSDIRLKENIRVIDDPFEIINEINGIKFTWKENGEAAYGFSAQEVEKILPEAVSEGEDGIKSVNYNSFIPVLLEAIKEQQTKIEELERRIEELERLILDRDD